MHQQLGKQQQQQYKQCKQQHQEQQRQYQQDQQHEQQYQQHCQKQQQQQQYRQKAVQAVAMMQAPAVVTESEIQHGIRRTWLEQQKQGHYMVTLCLQKRP
jgi:hypothetical protein